MTSINMKSIFDVKNGITDLQLQQKCKQGDMETDGFREG